MEATYTWTARRDALLDQLSELLAQLQEHQEGSENPNDLLDHLDGTRRALDRFAAILTDKYVQPSSTDFFSPGVSRPTSTATIASNASTATTDTSYKTRSSMGSFASYQSSPTTLISDPDVSDSLRQRILEEHDSHVLIDDDYEEDVDGEEGTEVKDTDESFERLSLMLNRVLEEAHAAISLPASPMRPGSQFGMDLEPRIDQVMEDDGRSTATMSSAAETVRPKSALDAPFETLPKRAGKLPRAVIPLTPEMMHPLKAESPAANILSPFPLAPVPKLNLSDSQISSTSDETTASSDKTDGDDGSKTELQQSISSVLEMSLDMITGDYVNDIVREIRMSEAIGNNVWMILVAVAMMWCFIYVSQGWGCQCEIPVR